MARRLLGWSGYQGMWETQLWYKSFTNVLEHFFESLLVFICSLLCLLAVKHVPFACVGVFDLHILWALLDEYRLVYLCCNTHMCASSTCFKRIGR